MDFDVLIVGAGPAGTAAAYALRADSLKVLVLDRANQGGHKPCAGGLTIKTLNLMPYSVASVIERVTTGVTIGVHSDKSDRLERIGHDDPICAFSVRARFDRLNLKMALSVGAEVATVAAIMGVEQVTGGVATTADGKRVTARYLVGADGANSVVRRLTADEAWFNRGFAVEGAVPYAAFGAEPPMELLFNVVKDGYGWLFPKDDHVNVGIYTCNPDVTLSKDRLLAYARSRVGTDRVEAIKGFPLGFGGARYRPRHDRIVLVGDAGGFAEPFLGEGIHNAIKTGQAAADAIVDVERGKTRSLAEAYDRRLRLVRKDLARCETLARRLFYPHLRLMEATALRRRSVRRAFLQGFAAGKTLREITSRFLFPPRYQPAVPASLRPFVDARPNAA